MSWCLVSPAQVGALDPGHPNHLQLLAVQQAQQQMSSGGPLPAVGLDGMPVPPPGLDMALLHRQAQQAAAAGCGGAAAVRSPFLDEDGLLTYLPDPLKVGCLMSHWITDHCFPQRLHQHMSI